jgi:hypothetical protein
MDEICLHLGDPAGWSARPLKKISFEFDKSHNTRMTISGYHGHNDDEEELR